MASSVIGALRVNLGLDSAQFVKGTQTAQTTMQKMSLKMIAVSAAITAAVGGAAVEMARMVRQSIDAAAEVGKISAALGMSSQEFQRAAFAAKTVNIESEKLADIFKDVNDKFGEFFQTGGGQLKDFFENIAPKIGVTAEQFRNLSGPQALQLYVSTLEKAGVNSQEMTFYLEALANDASRLAPLLGENGAKFKELGDEAQRLGIIIDGQTSKAAIEFNANLTRLKAISEGLAIRIAADVLPALVDMTEWMIRNQDSIVGVFRSTGELIRSLFTLGQLIARTGDALRNSLSPGLLDAIDKLSRMSRAATGMINPLSIVLRLMGRINGGDARQSQMDAAFGAVSLADALRPLPQFIAPVVSGLGGVSGGGRSAGGAMRALSSDTNDAARSLQTLMDRLFPAVAAMRKMREERAQIEASGLSDDQKASALFRIGTEDLGKATVSKGLLGEDPITDFKEALVDIAEKSEIQTVRIADSFAQMSQRVVSSLQGLTNSIRSGDFLGILGGVLDIITQLGGAGVFGKGLQSRVNAPIPGYANGTKYARGGLAMVGERGPELVSLNRGSQVIPNRALGGGGIAQIVPSPYFDVVVDGRIIQSAPAVANLGAMQAQAMGARSARRTIRR